MGPQLINNGCAVMRNLGKPLSDSERCQHVWQQAGGLTEGTGLEAAMVSGLPGVTLAKPSPTQIIPLPLGPLPPPTPLPALTSRGFPLTFGSSGGRSWPRCSQGFGIDRQGERLLISVVLCSEYRRAQTRRFRSILVPPHPSIINEACCRERLQI